MNNTFNGKFGNLSNGNYSPFNPFTGDYSTDPFETNLPVGGSVYDTPQIYEDEAPNVYDTNDMAKKTEQILTDITKPLTKSPVNTEAVSLVDKGTNFIKNNPLLSLVVAVGAGVVLFGGGKGK